MKELVASKDLIRTDGLFNMLNQMDSVENRWLEKIIRIIKVKFGPFVCAESGKLILWSKGLLDLIGL
jgi:hypothetical protein